MSKLVLLILAALAVSYLLDGKARGRRHRPAERRAPRPPAPTVGELVACATCGVHVVRDRSLGRGQRRFCSEACRRKASRP